MANGAENSSSYLSRIIYSLCLSLVSKAESSDKNLTDIFMNQSGLKSLVSKIGERFQRKLEKSLRIAMRNFRRGET